MLLDWDRVIEDYSYEAPESLPLFRATIEALWRWHSRWFSLFFAEDLPPADRWRGLDWKLLDEQRLRVWREVQTELGSEYHVFFYSERFERAFANRVEYDAFAASVKRA